MIKVALCLQNRELPPTVHFCSPNSNIAFQETVLRVQQSLGAWPEGDGPLIAGVSSFGFGGTNAHAVLSEAPPRESSATTTLARPIHLLPLSARSAAALTEQARHFSEFLAVPLSEPVAWQDILHTLAVRRDHHDFRLAIVVQSPEQAVAGLNAFVRGQNQPGLVSGRKTPGRRSKLAFVFSGQGPQWWGMGRQLLEGEPIFRAFIEQCDELLRAQGASWSLLGELLADESNSRLGLTEFAQPALFALQAGLAELCRSWGIIPDAVVGHSLGEVSAAYVAGVLSLEDAVRIIYHRGRLMQRAAGPGRMAAVALGAAQVREALNDCAAGVEIAAVNSPESTTVTGDRGALEAMIESFKRRGVQTAMLHVDCAFHSIQMAPARRELQEILAGLEPRPAAIPLYSTVTGTQSVGADMDAAYWGRNVREPVLFADAIARLVETHHDVFFEIGPHPVLASAIGQLLRQHNQEATILSSLRRNEQDQAGLLSALGALYARGYTIDWQSLYPSGRCVRLPAYAWQHQEFWLEPVSGRSLAQTKPDRLGDDSRHPLLGRHVQLAQPSGCHLWESEMSANDPGCKDCLSFGGTPLVSGTAFVERAAAAAKILFGEESCTLAQIDFPAPLFLPATGRVALQVILTQVAWGEASFAIFGQLAEPSGQPWTLHATGIARRGKASADRTPGPSSERNGPSTKNQTPARTS